MRHLTPFERDFEDLHGRGAFGASRVHVDVGYVPEAPRMRRSVRLGAGVGLAAISLFWVLVLGVVAIGGAIGIGAFIWALVTTPSPPY